ncbi:MAG: SspB family protein [Hyphomicrobiales bacterium]
MTGDRIRYDLLTQNALRGVVKTVLEQVARTGLPGDHHLYVAFDTRAPGVTISPRLKEQYPEEMTIVLQYQFWDLEISPDRFEVKLSFSDIPERLVVPFAAVKAFYDPSVQFGLQFGAPGHANDQAPEEIAANLPAIEAQDQDEEAADEPPTPPPAREAQAGGGAQSGSPAKVVHLDTFRKK